MIFKAINPCFNISAKPLLILQMLKFLGNLDKLKCAPELAKVPTMFLRY